MIMGKGTRTDGEVVGWLPARALRQRRVTRVDFVSAWLTQYQHMPTPPVGCDLRTKGSNRRLVLRVVPRRAITS